METRGLIVPDPDVRSIATKLLPPSGEYRAPETFTGPDNFTARSDIWALGCITFELATRKKAFATVPALQKYIVGAPVGSGDSNRALEEVNTLINDMLQRNPDERPSALTLFERFKRASSRYSGGGLLWLRCTVQ